MMVIGKTRVARRPVREHDRRTGLEAVDPGDSRVPRGCDGQGSRCRQTARHRSHPSTRPPSTPGDDSRRFVEPDLECLLAQGPRMAALDWLKTFTGCVVRASWRDRHSGLATQSIFCFAVPGRQCYKHLTAVMETSSTAQQGETFAVASGRSICSSCGESHHVPALRQPATAGSSSYSPHRPIVPGHVPGDARPGTGTPAERDEEPTDEAVTLDAIQVLGSRARGRTAARPPHRST